MAAITFRIPRKANSSRTTVRDNESTVAMPISRWLVAISSYSSTGTPVRPALTPLNSGRARISRSMLRLALMAFSAGTKLPCSLTGRIVITCCLPALSIIDGLPSPASLEERIHAHAAGFSVECLEALVEGCQHKCQALQGFAAARFPPFPPDNHRSDWSGW